MLRPHLEFFLFNAHNLQAYTLYPNDYCLQFMFLLAFCISAFDCMKVVLYNGLDSDKKFSRTCRTKRFSMFFLTKIEHKLQLPPHLLNLPLEQAVKCELDSVFLDKVIAKYGLCISVYDILSIKGGIILPTEGCPTYSAVFRMVMFRPFVGEVIYAKLKESTRDGLRLSVGFFDDIYIPAYLLPDPTVSVVDETDQDGMKWVWTYGDLPYDIVKQEEILFRVHKVEYPQIPLEQEEGSKPFAPMVVTGTLDADGLGHPSWWPDT